MTDRDAICVLECMAIDLTGCLAGLSGKGPIVDVLKQRINAINAAQVALQERLYREKGCDWCQGGSCDVVYGNGFHGEIDNGFLVVWNENVEFEGIRKINYCPMCGRKLKPAMPGEEQRG